MPGKFLVGVSAIIERDNKVLLLQRSSTKDHGAGEWEPVSGRMEPGETPVQAVIREVFEETSMRVSVAEPIDTFYFRRGKEQEELVGITYRCIYLSGELITSLEHSNAKWIATEDLLALDVIQPIKESFLKYLKLKSLMEGQNTLPQ